MAGRPATRGIVERQRSGNPGRHARSPVSASRPLRERKPFLRRHRPLEEVERARGEGRAEGAAHRHPARYRIAPQYLDQVVGGVVTTEPGDFAEGGSPAGCNQPETIAPSLVSRGAAAETGQRRDGQDAIGLPADPDHGQRAAGP
jgi:hypothetical protein